jgi:hypothetical protein
MRKYVTQVFEEINENPKLIEQYAKDPVYNNLLKILFEYAFVAEKRWDLPEGTPPFKPAAEPLGMTPTNLYGELRRLYVFNRVDLKPIKREGLFISLLEGIHPKEAELVIAIKDQALPKLYPKITRKLVTEAGLIPAVEKKSESASK